MPMWRCPHCGTPQAETARCWVCHRSSTACGTCRHFRRSVAGQLGYCGLDRTRQPLTGSEIRACWEGWPPSEAHADAVLTMGPPPAPDQHPHREFVEVGPSTEPSEPAEQVPAITRPATPAAEFGWSLWGDPDR